MPFHRALEKVVHYLDYNYTVSSVSTKQNLFGWDLFADVRETLINFPGTLDLVSEFFEDTFSVFHSSVPNIKLFYPEPFIASPTYIHEDIWFIHIVIYQYWLWFFFISIIVFFFLSFLITVRWCNVRNRPARETRGVSRSKCGDLITATVPVSWATSIIIHESTDAVEFYDGFGTTEMAVGIRAYQWGWEYYYPKDLNLSLKITNSINLGNSITNHHSISIDKFKNYYKTNNSTADIFDQSVTPFNYLYSNDMSFSDWLKTEYTLPGVNKLVSRNATNLITSQKLHDNSSLLKTYSLNSINTPLEVFYNNMWDNTSTPSPSFDNLSWLTLPTTSHFFSSSLFSNSKVFNYIFSKTREINKYSGVLDPISEFNLEETNFNTKTLLEGTTLKKLELDSINNPIKYSTFNYYLNTGLLKTLNNSHDEWKNIFSIKNNIKSLYSVTNDILNYSNLKLNLYADQDFKRWSTHEMIEDLIYQESMEPIAAAISLDNFKFNNFSSRLSDTTNLIKYNWNVCNMDILPFNSNNANLIYYLDYKNYLLKGILSSSITNSFLSFKNKFITLNDVHYLRTSILENFKSISKLEIIFKFALSESVQRQLNTQGTTPWLSLMQNSTQSPISTQELVTKLKPLLTYYQAFWKIFKSNLEEERSFFNYQNFSRNKDNLPVVSNAPYELVSLMQKNNNVSFYNILFFRKNYQLNLNSVDRLSNLLNFFSVKFPFTVSLESDIIRYSWFDWYSNRSNITTKSIDTSVFGLNGVKQFDYSFTKEPKMELLNKYDNFFMRYNNARRLTLPTYLYSPYRTNEFMFSVINKNLINIIQCAQTEIKLNLYKLSIGWALVNYTSPALSILNSPQSLFTSIQSSGLNSTNHNYYSNLNSLTSQSHSITQLNDILSKQNYVTKNILNVTSTNLQNNNKLLNLLLTSTDVIFKTDPFDLSYINSGKYKSWEYENFTLKSQYQPMRKGITNMIRIQADKAIAMPTDTRLQILAVSKDIIHSWSIPSAGIKIDCIPGYSSHRVVYFTLSGIYWGQCMEICGRFHHWMPIVVYFLKRDLFCMWCIHFIFNSKQVNNLYQGFNQNNLNSLPELSVPTNSWIYELDEH